MNDVSDICTNTTSRFYNDCIYMSHNCTLMTHLYRGEYKKANVSFADSVAFIDFIPRLRYIWEILNLLNVSIILALLVMLCTYYHFYPFNK